MDLMSGCDWITVTIAYKPHTSKMTLTSEAKIARLQQDLKSAIKTSQALRKKLTHVTDERQEFADLNDALKKEAEALRAEVAKA